MQPTSSPTTVTTFSATRAVALMVLAAPVKPRAGLLPAALITAESADDHYVIGMRPNRLKWLRLSFRQFTRRLLAPGDEAVPVASALQDWRKAELKIATPVRHARASAKYARSQRTHFGKMGLR